MSDKRKLNLPYQGKNHNPRVGISFPLEEGKTIQSFLEETDINKIVEKYQQTGALDHVNRRLPEYGFATGDSFNESMNIIVKAKEMFEELPSSIRNKMDNDPAKFLDFVQNPENAEKMVEMGLSQGKPREGHPLASGLPVAEPVKPEEKCD